MTKNEKIIDFFYGLGGSLVPKIGKTKKPAVKKWNTVKIPREEFKREYLGRLKSTNVAFLIPDGFLVIDVEAHKGGLEQVATLKRVHGIDIMKTFHVRTGRKGIHAYYRVDSEKTAIRGYLKDFNAIEVKTPGEMVTIPPSTTVEGSPYNFGKIKMEASNVKKVPAKADGLFFRKGSERRGGEKPADPKSKRVSIKAGDIRQLRYLLNYIDPLEFSSYHEWIKILFAAYDMSGGSSEGKEAFIEWSIQDPEYEKAAAKISVLWGKAKKMIDESEGLITFRTLVYLAVKEGAQIDHNVTKLFVEILSSDFRFCSVRETSAQLLRYLGGGRDPLRNLERRKVAGEEWTLLTGGAISVVLGHIHAKAGIFIDRFSRVMIEESCEKNKISLFELTYSRLAKEFPKDIKTVEEATSMRKFFFKVFSHKSKAYAEEVFPRFVKYMVSMVRLQLQEFDDEFVAQSQTCLCLYSDQQGLGKSTIARLLSVCPELIYPLSLKSIRDNEVKIALSRASVALIDDYQPSGMKELNFLNELITQNTILARPKYGRIEETFRRRAPFMLTTNYHQIINDPTGSRRWLILDLVGIDIPQARKLVGAVHGEALSLARNDFRHYDDIEEIKKVEIQNSEFSGVETIDHIFINHFAIDETLEENQFKSAADVLRDINRGYGKGTVRDVRQISSTIRRLFPKVTDVRIRHGAERIRLYNLVETKPFETYGSYTKKKETSEDA